MMSPDFLRSLGSTYILFLVEAGTEIVDGYPSAVALLDGSVYAVYVFHGASTVGGTRLHPKSPEFGG